MEKPNMSATRTLPDALPSDSKDLLGRLLNEVRDGPADTQEKLYTSAAYAVALLLPRFAGTMLRLLLHFPVPASDLLEEAARFQKADPKDRGIQFRLADALDYLRRTGSVEQVGSQVGITPFGKQVFQTRIGKAAPGNGDPTESEN
jgi:hypothetical protein